MKERTRQFLMRIWIEANREAPRNLPRYERLERIHQTLAWHLADRAGLPKARAKDETNDGRFLWAIQIARRFLTERAQNPYWTKPCFTVSDEQ